MTGPLRERDDAHALLAAEAERARAGIGRLVLLRGASGTGRSAVLEAAAAHATHLGLRVLRARCSPEDTALPFSSVLHLLGPVPEFADVAPGFDDRDSAARLWRLLRSYADEAPLMVAVDDVHLADEASRRWFVEAARRIDRLPVLLVATERSQYDIDLRPAGLTHALSPSAVRTHTLAPLTDHASADLVRAAFPTASDRWTADCVRAGAGNPLLLHALLDDLVGVPPPTAVPQTCAALYPGAYPAAVSWWLDSAGPTTAEVARTLAALELAEQTEQIEQTEQPEDTGVGRTGGPTCAAPAAPAAPATPASLTALAALLAEASGADHARVSGWLTAMTRLGVLRRDAPDARPRYAHPLLRDAVLAGWSTARRQDAHRAVAHAMLRRGDHVDAVARQLLAAAPTGLPWALRVLREAATVAVRDGRPGDAVRYLSRALREPLPDDLRQRLLTELGSLEYASADAPGGIPRLAEALDLPADPRDQVRTAIALGTALAGRGEVRTAVEALRRLESRLPAGHADLARTLQTASALLSDQDQTVRGEAYRWLTDTAERSPELVGASGQALLVRYAATAGEIPAREAMRRLRTLLTEPADPLAEPFLLGTAAAVAQWADELDEAERLLERGLAGQHPSLLHPMEQALLDTRWDIAAARGTYAALLAEHPRAPGASARRRTGGGPANADAHTVLALVETGRTQEARRLADTFDLWATPDSWELNRFLYARGVLRFTEGDVAGALHDFLECGRRQSARAVLSPVVTPWRTAAAECRLALGNPQEALTLAAEELRLARVWDTPRTLGRALRVLGRATRGRRGLQLGEEAVTVLRNSPAEAELIASLLAQGHQLISAGERTRGRDYLREGAERAERLGSERLLRYADQALRTAGARRTTPTHTGSTSLTGSERRIAELAAEGHTNTQIANLLHVARRTVETHLTNTYKKLGIRRRSELRGALEE
ncbi:Predicted ATPase [Streptomyces sp. yr375]|uniref:AAA family ATPase n=1 Tax=Streptomyces sp. yr375 TaxID=1761906 RepID=UPI0008B923A9|nr:LuxR family transcriptional regulator [Streptomyces sp. yr375]SES34909.1 Predicted ATPase [Streptomyces sp. yr375]